MNITRKHSAASQLAKQIKKGGGSRLTPDLQRALRQFPPKPFQQAQDPDETLQRVRLPSASSLLNAEIGRQPTRPSGEPIPLNGAAVLRAALAGGDGTINGST